VHIGAAGVSNQLDWSVGFAVFGPSVLYPDVTDFSVGAAVDIAPLNIFWQPLPGETVTYSVAAGQLPAGLAIDPRSGRITGTVSAAGSYAYQLRADVASAGRAGFVVQAGVTNVNTYLPSSRGYPDAVGPYVGLPVDVTPAVPSLAGMTFDFELVPESTGTALPLGLSFDPATGRLFGTPIEPSLQRWEWQITEHFGGQTQIAQGEFQFAIFYPVYITYDDCRWMQPCAAAPTVTLIDPRLSDASFAFALDPSTPLPPGLQIDPVSGVISGVPATPQGGPFTIDVTVTRNGVSFVMPIPFHVYSG
jgi:hypothetical protein